MNEVIIKESVGSIIKTFIDNCDLPELKQIYSMVKVIRQKSY